MQHDRIVDKNGNLFDTSDVISIGKEGEPIPNNKAIFVMSEKGNIYISKFNEWGKFHHSSFLAGEKVSAAGEITIEKGKITFVSDRSGHYMPNLEIVKKNIVDELIQRDYFYPATDNKTDRIIFKSQF